MTDALSQFIIEFVANNGISSLVLLYSAWWMFNRGVPLLNNWINKLIASNEAKIERLGEKDATLSGEIQKVLRELAIVNSRLNDLIKLSVKHEDRIAYLERKNIEILNGLGYNRKWDDPKHGGDDE